MCLFADAKISRVVIEDTNFERLVSIGTWEQVTMTRCRARNAEVFHATFSKNIWTNMDFTQAAFRFVSFIDSQWMDVGFVKGKMRFCNYKNIDVTNVIYEEMITTGL